MKIGLFSGVLVVLFMITLSQSVGDYFWLVLVSGGLGIGAFAVSTLLAVPVNGGDGGSQAERAAWAANLFFFGLPNIVAACTGWFLL